MSARSQLETYVLAAIAVVAVLTFLYSLLVRGAILAWFGVVTPLLLLYLAWRFVRAHERIAETLESSQMSDVGRDSTDE